MEKGLISKNPTQTLLCLGYTKISGISEVYILIQILLPFFVLVTNLDTGKKLISTSPVLNCVSLSVFAGVSYSMFYTILCVRIDYLSEVFKY